MTREHSTIARALLQLAQERGPDKTYCPSEIARSLGGENWRELMPEIRAAAAPLVATGALRCTQRGAPVNPAEAHGPIRLSLGASD